SRQPLVQVVFALQNAPSERLELPGLKLTALPVATGTAKFELTCTLTEAEGGLAGTLEYSRDLFEGPTMERLAGHLVRLLSASAEDSQRRLSELPLLSAAEREQLLVEWSGESTAYPREATIHALFAEQAALRPEAVAVVGLEESLTYGELERRSGRWARRLRAAGVGPEVRVGVCLERSPLRVVATLAVLEAGGTYVPLDPSYPQERLSFLVRDSAASVLLTEQRWLASLPETGAAVLCMDREELPEGEETVVEAPQVLASGLAYVMYTSGSTGEPKGVAVPHRAVVRLVKETGYACFGPDEVFLQLAPYAFDASTLEVWGALLHGGRVVMPPPGVLSPGQLGDLLSRHGVTTLWLTAGLFHQMVEENLSGLAVVRQLLAGGDVLSVPHVRRVLAALPGTRLINGYGPTENTTFTCCHAMAGSESLESSVPLGRPIANTQVYVLDRDLQPLPAGVAGELFAGGDGLARGYLSRPERTAERFVPDPFGREPGGRLYRTGDLVRWRPAGDLEFLGRLDTQVKVRGFRVEPGEIEAALSAHPWVRDAVVLVEKEGAQSRRLVAYVVVAEEEASRVSEAGVRDFLRARLPDFMLPAAYVFLPWLPLTANGKVDRKALAELRPARVAASAGPAPRTPVEELVSGIFAEVLHLERVGLAEDFFTLGGHSLLATQVVSRVQSIFGVELPVRAVFETPTVEGLAGRLDRSVRSEEPVAAIGRVSREERLVLSFAQQRLWFLDQLEPGSAVYNIPAQVELTGQLDRAALESALREVVRRHESLRTTFEESGGEPAQVIGESAGFTLPVVDLQGLPERGSEVSRLAGSEARRPFDLARGPLLRAVLLRLEAERHVVLLTMHHIVSDGWSMGVLMRELGALYTAFVEGRPSPLPELAMQYADFAFWQRRHLSCELLESELAWWRGQLTGMPAALDLPADHPRPAVRSVRGAVRGFRIDGESLARLTALSRRHGTTLFMTLLAGFLELLRRYTGEDDLVVGTPIAGRTRVETEPLIGFFVNTLVLRTDLSGNLALSDLLGGVRETTLSAYAHQEVPFERLVEELAPEQDLSRQPLVQVVFALQNAPSERLELPGLKLTALPVATGTAKFELTC
ncbi:MAG TPA: amino acid adenylation domain-containing protein, partial [Thermoanaerobaculia bacterium]|nr:amino acid adenylation domain-containing protein [Thermoanaerobaculia bacterium]